MKCSIPSIFSIKEQAKLSTKSNISDIVLFSNILNQHLLIVPNFVKYCSQDLRKIFQKVTEKNDNMIDENVVGFLQSQRHVQNPVRCLRWSFCKIMAERCELFMQKSPSYLFEGL